MERVSRTTTTVITDKRIFKTTAPSGEVYLATVTAESRETNVASPDAREPRRLRLKTTTRKTLGRQVHRAAPYPGASPVRIASLSRTTTVIQERIVLRNDLEE